MSGDEGRVPDRTRALMMAVLDGESTAAERSELEARLSESPELEREWARLTRVKEATAAMTLKRPPDEVWNAYWSSVYNRLERRAAWLLVVLGVVVLLAYGLWHAVPALAEGLLGATDLPVAVRLAVVALLTGVVLLIVSVVREQVAARRSDAYEKGVSR